MTERPILFSGAMVRAILEGRKTMTRRVISEQNICFGSGSQPLKINGITPIRCPYGKPGDRLWVRETMRVIDSDKGSDPEYMGQLIQYAADGSIRGWTHGEEALSSLFPFSRKIIPSIFMPRWASRITLEVTAVRAEQLNDISEEDVQREGVTERLVSDCIAPIASRANAVPEYWIGGYDQGSSWCDSCGKRKIKELKKTRPKQEYYLDGGWPTEGDSQAFCGGCNRVLDNNFTTYACQSEVDHFKQNGWSLNPLDCLSLGNILWSYGWNDSERCNPEDRIANDIHRLGFHAVWDSINGKRPGCAWADNPYVWVVEFRRIEK